MEQKLGEWRPDECNTRLGDIVRLGDEIYIKIKCRRCSKLANYDVFHLSTPLRVDSLFTTSVDNAE